MAQYALPPGAVRRRTVFGLLDADGWGWASLKATFWFLLIIFLLGYVPDRAYYLVVSPTIDLGYNAISIINNNFEQYRKSFNISHAAMSQRVAQLTSLLENR